jgi:hypothetical protein
MGLRFWSMLGAAAWLANVCGCSCSRLGGEVDSFAFTRCAQAAPPAERRLSMAGIEIEIEARRVRLALLARVDRSRDELRVAAFAGPVGAAFARADLAQLAQSRAQVLLILGGLGDTVDVAAANLSALAALRLPTVFLPGGADRLEVVEGAFARLDERSAAWMIQASGVRELWLGEQRFAVLPGAALGRYALDDGSCGFEPADLEALREALADSRAPAGKRTPTWPLSWNAPAGWGVSEAGRGLDVGSRELAEAARALGARGGLFAYPEVQASQPGRAPQQGGLAWVVPRLSRTGSQRSDGGRLPGSFALLQVSAAGLAAAP